MLFVMKNKEVRGFDIAMNHLMIMRILESTSSLMDKMSDILWREQLSVIACFSPYGKRIFFTERHDHINKSPPVIYICFTIVVEGQDMRMVEHTYRLHLSLKEKHIFFR